jgi:phage terminase large subunit-like protein
VRHQRHPTGADNGDGGLRARKLARGGNPGNPVDGPNVAVAQDPAGNLKPAKDKSTERIDGIVATIMAIGRAMLAQEDPQPTYQMFILG